MIRLIPHDHPALAQVPGDPLLAAVVEAEALAGGGGAPGEFWLILGEDGKAGGAVCRVGGLVRATLCRGELAPEAAAFLEGLGWCWLETDGFLAPLLSGVSHRYLRMEYTGTVPASQLLCPPSVMETVRCNVAAGALPPEALEERYTHLHLLSRRGAAQVFLVPGKDGAPAAASALSHIGAVRGVIGYLAALPHKRGQGYGTAALQAAVKACLELERTPVLACREELEPFYQARGFFRTGEIWALQR